MIQSQQDLKAYITIDWKRNLHCDYSRFVYIKRLLLCYESAFVFRYLKSLRKLEYVINCKKGKSAWGNMLYYLRWWYYMYLSRKYGLLLLPNAIGAGIYIPHLTGGVIIVCKSMGISCTVNAGTIIGVKNKNR